jgi:hypothetical protein
MISDEIRDKIYDRYMIISNISNVAKEFDIDEKIIIDIIKNYKNEKTPRELRHKKYFFDLDFFEKIDSNEKAYMLGFIYGDGSLKDDHLSIELASKDEYILESFRNLLGKENAPPIHHRIRDRKGTTTYSSYIIFCGHTFVSHLFKLGLVKDKSSVISYPNISYHSDFIRGLSDSDGCIRIDEQNRGIWSLISSTSMCNSVSNILKDNDIFSRVIGTKFNGLSRVNITKKSEIVKLRNFLYYDNCICLNRKRDKFFSVKYKINCNGSNL